MDGQKLPTQIIYKSIKNRWSLTHDIMNRLEFSLVRRDESCCWCSGGCSPEYPRGWGKKNPGGNSSYGVTVLRQWWVQVELNLEMGNLRNNHHCFKNMKPRGRFWWCIWCVSRFIPKKISACQFEKGPAWKKKDRLPSRHFQGLC